MSKHTEKNKYHSGPFHFKRTDFDQKLQSHWCTKCEDGNIIAGKKLKPSIEKYHNCSCKNCNCGREERSNFDNYMNTYWCNDCDKGADGKPLY